MTIGKRIKKLRTNANISQVDFAKSIGVSKQTLYKYENDIITNIPSDKIELIAEKTNTTPAYIMGWELGDEEIADVIHENIQCHIFTDSDKANLFSGADLVIKEILGDILEKQQMEEFTRRLNEKLPKDFGIPKQSTIAAHFEGDDFTEDEQKEIAQFIDYVKSKRN